MTPSTKSGFLMLPSRRQSPAYLLRYTSNQQLHSSAKVSCRSAYLGSMMASRCFVQGTIQRLYLLARLKPRPFLDSRYYQTLSPRQRADIEERLKSEVGRSVKDPALNRELGSLGWLNSRCVAFSRDGKSVEVLLRLPSLLHPELEKLKERVAVEAKRVLHLWGKENISDSASESVPSQVNVEAIANSPVPFMSRLVENPEDLIKELGPGLESVSHVLAVYSCKGGVGKSTVAVNLAYELARMGGRVGLLDLDLYGPSLPTLVQPNDLTVRRSPRRGSGMVFPIEHEGIRLLSLGFVNSNSGVQGSGSDNGAAIMRGPLVVKVVAQLLKGTDWGQLDVLVLDLPPGTGDVQLAVCQDLTLSGAVAVTTPSKLALTDTRKGMEMFTSLGVPTLAVVENMSYFVCEGGKKHYPFGTGSVATASKGSNIPPSVRFPISPSANDATESGKPICLARPETASEELQSFQELGTIVSRELLRVQYGDTETDDCVTLPNRSDETFAVASIQLSLDKTSSPPRIVIRLFSSSGACQERIHPAGLRSRDPKTGILIEDSPFRDQVEESNNDILEHHQAGKSGTGKVSPSLTPVMVQRKGRYGFAVQWSDGATIIYSKLCLARAAGGEVVKTELPE